MGKSLRRPRHACPAQVKQAALGRASNQTVGDAFGGLPGATLLCSLVVVSNGPRAQCCRAAWGSEVRDRCRVPCVLDELHSGTGYSAKARSAVLLSRQFTLNKVPLIRNTYKTSMHAHGHLSSMSPLLSGHSKLGVTASGRPVPGSRKYFKAHQDDSVISTGFRNVSLSKFLNISILPLVKQLAGPSSPVSKPRRLKPSMCPGLLCTDSALLCSGFCLPAQVGITSSKHRANSPDPRARGQVPRVQVPAIPQHGKGAHCPGRPQDNTPPLPSPLAQQEKIFCARVIRMEFLFNTSESHQPRCTD